MRGRVVVAVCVALNVYVTLGGVAIYLLEAETEVVNRQEADNLKLNYLRNNTCLDEKEFDELARAIIQSYRQGVIRRYPGSQNGWDYINAIFFAYTMVTTIGYGNITPVTMGCRAFCCFFAIVGIPLCLITLTGVGDFINRGSKKLQDKLSSRKSWAGPRVAGAINTVLILAISVSLFILIPAAVFDQLEEWTFGESLYYCFITMTTIGFGDFVPGEDPDTPDRGLYEVFVGIWAVAGLAWAAGLITQGVDVYQTAQRRASELYEGFDLDFELDLGRDSDKKADDPLDIETGEKATKEGFENETFELDSAKRHVNYGSNHVED